MWYKKRFRQAVVLRIVSPRVPPVLSHACAQKHTCWGLVLPTLSRHSCTSKCGEVLGAAKQNGGKCLACCLCLLVHATPFQESLCISCLVARQVTAGLTARCVTPQSCMHSSILSDIHLCQNAVRQQPLAGIKALNQVLHPEWMHVTV